MWRFYSNSGSYWVESYSVVCRMAKNIFPSAVRKYDACMQSCVTQKNYYVHLIKLLMGEETLFIINLSIYFSYYVLTFTLIFRHTSRISRFKCFRYSRSTFVDNYTIWSVINKELIVDVTAISQWIISIWYHVITWKMLPETIYFLSGNFNNWYGIVW